MSDVVRFRRAPEEDGERNTVGVQRARVVRWGPWAALFGAAFAVHIVWLLSGGVTVFRDTDSYFDLGIDAGDRLPVVPFVYTLLGNHQLIVVVQALALSVAWVTLALVVSRDVRAGWPRWTVAILTVIAGSTPGLATWSRRLISEPLSNALLVLAFAASVQLLRRPSQRSAGAVVVLFALWMACRPQNIVMMGVLLPALVLLLWCSRRQERDVRRAIALLIVIVVAAIPLGFRNAELQHANLLQIIGTRVVTDPATFDWWRSEGMPAAAEELAARAPNDLTLPPFDEELDQWIRSEGRSTYLRFLASHPGQWVRPLGRAIWPGTDGRSGDEIGPLLFQDNIDPRLAPVPRTVDAAVGLLLTAVVLAQLIDSRRSAGRWSPSALLGAGTMIAGVVLVVPSWLGAGLEMERLALTPAVLLRLGSLAVLAAWCTTRWPASAST